MKHSYLFTFFLACMPFAPAAAQQIRIDSTYGNNGFLEVSFPYYNGGIGDTKIFPDGGFVASGWLYDFLGQDYSYGIIKVNPDGSLDNSFGTGGKVKTNFGINYGQNIDTQSDGKIIVVGRAYHPQAQVAQPGAVRFLSNGLKDNSFGTNGLVYSNFPGGHVLEKSVLVQPDDKILVAGDHFSVEDGNIGISRYTPNGKPDSTFSFDGHLMIDITPLQAKSTDGVVDIGLQSDGKIIVAGHSIFSDSVGVYTTLVRLKTNGQLDPTFGNNGKVVWQVPIPNHYMGDIEILPDNKILCLLYNQDIYDVVLAQFESNGSPDLSFGINGTMTDALQTNDSLAQLAARKMTVVGDKIYVIGYSYLIGPNDYSWFLASFKNNGLRDSTFAEGGFFLNPYPNTINFIPHFSTIGKYSESKILLFGSMTKNQYTNFLATRIITDLNVGLIDHQTGAENTLFYPNPIQDQSTLKYTLNNRQKVSIALINSIGQTITVFKDQENQDPGEYQIPLEFPSGLSSGVYFLNIRTEAGTTTVKIMKN